MPISLKKDDGRLFHFYTRNRKTYERSSWIQFFKGWTGVMFTVGIGSYFDSRIQITISFGYGTFYFNLPIYTKYDECDPPDYGFYYYNNALWICYGRKVKKIGMPWEYDWVRTSKLCEDGSWEHETKGNRKDFYKDEWADVLWKETYPYKYTLKNGTIQERFVNVTVEEREWRPMWFKWTSLFAKKRKTIAVEFNDEVGERTGSWKGGVLGCGYEMKYGELPEQTLVRMQKERKFT
jgi:hypothetical protein